MKLCVSNSSIKLFAMKAINGQLGTAQNHHRPFAHQNAISTLRVNTEEAMPGLGAGNFGG